MTDSAPGWLADMSATLAEKVEAAKAAETPQEAPDSTPAADADAEPSPVPQAASEAAEAAPAPTPAPARKEPAEVDPYVPRAGNTVYTKRTYQVDAMNEVVDALLDDCRRVLLVSPTGSGKNHMTAMILSNKRLRQHFGLADDEDMRVMYFAHKHELLLQGEREVGGAPGVKLIVQSIFSDIPEDVLAEGWHFSIHDEAHHEPMMSFQQKLGYISDAQMLGLTATPERADKFSLKFDAVIEAITREEAVAQGYLAPATVHSVVDMGALDKPELLGELIDEYGKRMERTLIYLKTKEQVHSVNRMLRDKGYRSAALVEVTKTRRGEIKAQFETGELDFVVNCQMLDEGVDFKGVKGVIIARGVQSGPLLNQIIGRAARIDEPECHIWQFVDPLRDNLDACSIVGRQVDHHLYYIRGGKWHCDRMSAAVMVDDSGDAGDADDAGMAGDGMDYKGVACA